jgi:hypothetical protein
MGLEMLDVTFIPPQLKMGSAMELPQQLRSQMEFTVIPQGVWE